MPIIIDIDRVWQIVTFTVRAWGGLFASIPLAVKCENC